MCRPLHDNNGQLRSAFGKEAVGGTNRLNEQFSYQYDPAGNLAVRANNDLVQTFAVDSLNQLTTVARNTNMTVAGTTTSHATSVTVNGGSAILYNDATFARTNVGLVDGNNTFTAIAQDAYGRQDTNTVTAYLPATTVFVYDANGNLRTNGQEILEYDEENRLVTNYVAGSWKSEFVYDGLSRRRIQRDYAWSNGGWTKTNEMRLIYDGNVIIQHRDANNLPTLALTRGLDLSGSLQKAGGIGGLLAMTENPGTSPAQSYYHSDGNGNVTALISPNQMVVAKAIYDPYGGFISLSGPKAAVNPYWFSSKPMHAASGKYDFLYRWYAPDLHRWITRDPILERGDKNLYRFVENNPIQIIDGVGFGRIGPAYGIPGVPNGIVSAPPPPSSLDLARAELATKVAAHYIAGGGDLTLQGHPYSDVISGEDSVNRLHATMLAEAARDAWSSYSKDDKRTEGAFTKTAEAWIDSTRALSATLNEGHYTVTGKWSISEGEVTLSEIKNVYLDEMMWKPPGGSLEGWDTYLIDILGAWWGYVNSWAGGYEEYALEIWWYDDDCKTFRF